VETGVALIEAFRACAPDEFKWREPPYEYEHTKLPIDILAGSSELREQIDGGMSANEIARSWQIETDRFVKVRQNYLLY
jgi:uncharacterized protein YbbC (DUF1343 family)